jgi:hypothetical protein
VRALRLAGCDAEHKRRGAGGEMMEQATIGNNTVTVCPKCDEVIVVKGAYSDKIDAAFDYHLSLYPECKKYYDEWQASLPTLEEMRGSIDYGGKVDYTRLGEFD